MKKHSLLLVLVIMITFIGGFFIGTHYPNKNSKLERSEATQFIKAKKAPLANRNLVPKITPKVDSKKSKVLIGYVQDFRDPKTVNYAKMTHVIFSFAHPTKDGQVLFNGDWALANLRATVKNAHQNNTKAMLAVGGWFHILGGESYPYFKAAISNPSSRTKLVNELINVVERENLDGIDIDFEHPRSAEDAKNLRIFIKDLSAKLHDRKKELSIAVNAKVHSVAGTEIRNVVYEPSMFKDVDHVNIMAYDGQWDGEYNAANLSPYPYNVNIVNYWSTLFDKNNISREKLVLGIPLYAQPVNPKIKQVSYDAIIKNNVANSGQDVVEMNGTTYYYNGEETVKKKTYLALDNNLGGIMLWETGLDAQGNHSMVTVITRELEMENVYTKK